KRTPVVAQLHQQAKDRQVDKANWKKWVMAKSRLTRTVVASRDERKFMDKRFEHPLVTVATLPDRLNVTSAGANDLVRGLLEIGLLKEITGYARNRPFRFDLYLRLFE
ncbi:MAG TPA: hypothetical protein PKW42_09805, partial [bacterium]|nr:hypothetical protein [bacterium]